ncbi:site-specific integrase [Lacticaseibacillus saniviri]|nr:site-specific integrase [Lacticaseibacillus saniviri]
MSEGYIRKRGEKYYYSFEIAGANGKRKRIERVGGYTEKEAKKALRKAIDEYENGGMNTKMADMSVADYFAFWLTNYVEKNLKFNTRKNYKNVVNRYINPKIGKYRIKSLSPATIQHFIDEVAEEPLDRTGQPPKKHTVEIILTIVKEALKKAVYPYKIINDNPASYVEMPKYAPLPATTKQDLKIITVEQFEKILEQTPPADPFHMPLVIAFYTGMRRGEVCGLQWDMVNLDEGYIQIERQMIQKGNGVFDLESPKSAAGYRTIVIGPTLINELKEKRKSQMENRVRYGILYNENNFVCTRNNGDPILPTYIRYRSRKINDNFGIPFSFHSLRHTHATMLLEAGEKPKVVQERLGHSKISTTMDTYMHVTNTMRQDTVLRFENFVQQKKTN